MNRKIKLSKQRILSNNLSDLSHKFPKSHQLNKGFLNSVELSSKYFNPKVTKKVIPVKTHNQYNNDHQTSSDTYPTVKDSQSSETTVKIPPGVYPIVKDSQVSDLNCLMTKKTKKTKDSPVRIPPGVYPIVKDSQVSDLKSSIIRETNSSPVRIPSGVYPIVKDSQFSDLNCLTGKKSKKTKSSPVIIPPGVYPIVKDSQFSIGGELPSPVRPKKLIKLSNKAKNKHKSVKLDKIKQKVRRQVKKQVQKQVKRETCKEPEVYQEIVKPEELIVKEQSMFKDNVKVTHTILSSYQNRVNICMELESKKHYEKITIKKEALVVNPEVSLLDIYISGEYDSWGLVTRSECLSDFHQTGLIGWLKLNPHQKVRFVYSLGFTNIRQINHFTDETSFYELKNGYSEKLSFSFPVEPETDNGSLVEKNGLNYKMFGKKTSLSLENYYQISIGKWTEKLNYPNIYTEFKYKLDSRYYRISGVYGLTADNVLIRLNSTETYNAEIFGTVVCPIGQEFDKNSPKELFRNKNSIRSIVFTLKNYLSNGLNSDQQPTIVQLPERPKYGYDVANDVDKVYFTLRLLNQNVITDQSNGLCNPTMSTVNAARDLSTILENSKYFICQGKERDYPTKFSFNPKKDEIAWSQTFVAKDELEKEFSILALKHEETNYIISLADNITFSEAIRQFEKQLELFKS